MTVSPPDTIFIHILKVQQFMQGIVKKKIVCLIDDDDLASVIWTQGFKALPIVVDACSMEGPLMLPITKSANEATRHEFISSVFIAFLVMMVKWVCQEYKSSGSHGKGPVDWVIKIGDTIVVIEAKREDINQSSKLLEDRDLDAFLDEVQKKKVITDEMRQMKQSKKLREDDSQKNLDSGCS
ncbi:hypothetical protein RhiirA5_371920 [Rhizophagus irregularis]|uniref:Uncharacterized protein n=1 Tax=Rhizophagus irregularis TaxID=588596 RepID=A0A2I1F5J8_9GLOM|nr:hypothetical protein RhiirA5_371920 [Rhizophagus irregularis]PKC58600.1 hypothetical protein RhiirA1_495362 [Rhizophagus irregularis]PKY29651.1 hypothetical protein RhiirB3_484123 [Rhizophagus irregularis]